MVDDAGPKGSLYVVSTPIGNLRDITLRAIDVLRTVDLILAEDTRHSRHLLDHHGIATPMLSYHEHNEARATATAIARLREGRDVALISDAGTPLVSDPGARVVRAAAEAGITVVPIPGPSAVLAALVSSALGSERFTFFGFLARKGREREDALQELSSLRHTSVLYEAPNRVAATLGELGARGVDFDLRRPRLARESDRAGSGVYGRSEAHAVRSRDPSARKFGAARGGLAEPLSPKSRCGR